MHLLHCELCPQREEGFARTKNKNILHKEKSLFLRQLKFYVLSFILSIFLSILITAEKKNMIILFIVLPPLITYANFNKNALTKSENQNLNTLEKCPINRLYIIHVKYIYCTFRP